MPVHCNIRDRVASLVLEGRTDGNVFSPHYVYDDLVRVLGECRDDPAVSCAVISAPLTKKAFTFGGDIQSLDASRRGDASLTRGYGIGQSATAPPALSPRTSEGLFSGGFDMPKPLIFAVHGYCLGAGTLLLSFLADIIVASEDTKFGWTEIKIGPGAVGVGPGMFLRQLPWHITLELITTGRMFTAREAYQWGFINKVVATKEEALSAALSYADTIKAHDPAYLQAMKELGLVHRNGPNH